MPTIARTLSSRVGADGTSEVLLRLSLGRGRVFRLRSGIRVPAARWNGKAGTVTVSRIVTADTRAHSLLNSRLNDLSGALLSFCSRAAAEGCDVTREALMEEVSRFHDPSRPVAGDITVERAISVVAEESRGKRREGTLGNYLALLSQWRGFVADCCGKSLMMREVTPDILREFEEWLRKDGVRGGNTVVSIMRRLSVVFNRAVRRDLIPKSPFRSYSLPAFVYGTPYYLTIAERDALYHADMGDPYLSEQRDIFVFQCLVGCRVSDLLLLTRSSVVDGAIEYVPVKTSGKSGRTVRVPLTATAKEIIARYEGRKDEALLPFASYCAYIRAIKRIFAVAGLTRPVTVLNTKTRKEERRPLNEIASSHLARRTFIGNLYKKVKDPNLVGSLSGHAEGSQAFARYRNIDEEMRTALVGLLEEREDE